MTATQPPNHRGRSIGVGLLGCLGLGGLGTVAIVVVVGLVVGSLKGCDVNLDPGTGQHSARLAVRVSPATGLQDRTVVRVTSNAFDKRSIVGVAVCLREADTRRKGVEACDERRGIRFATDAKGRLDVPFPVPRMIVVGGQAFDCAAKVHRCLVVAADANDYDRSGGQPISFEPSLPAAEAPPIDAERPQSDHLKVGARPAGPQPAGSTVTVLASGFQPGEPLLVAWCTDQFDEIGPLACEPVNQTAAMGAVMLRSLPAEPLATDEGIATIEADLRATIRPVGDIFGTASDGSSTTTTTRRDGRVDCRIRPGRCSIVVAAAADTKRSAVLPYALSGR